MNRFLKVFAVVVLLLMLANSTMAANVKFYCHDYNKGDECAFSIQTPNGYTNFTVPAGGVVEYPAAYKGDRYCVRAGKAPQPPCHWPECWEWSGRRIVKDVND
jgi:hypothetical protein